MKHAKKFTGCQKADRLFSKLSHETFKKFGFANYKIISDWTLIIGPKLAAYCIPQRIDFPPQQTTGGVLYIAISNPGLSLEIQAQEGQIINRLATYFGYKAIARIKIIIDKNAERKPPVVKKIKKEILNQQEALDLQNAITNIKDDKLKNNLNELFATLFEQKN